MVQWNQVSENMASVVRSISWNWLLEYSLTKQIMRIIEKKPNHRITLTSTRKFNHLTRWEITFQSFSKHPKGANSVVKLTSHHPLEKWLWFNGSSSRRGVYFRYTTSVVRSISWKWLLRYSLTKQIMRKCKTLKKNQSEKYNYLYKKI